MTRRKPSGILTAELLRAALLALCDSYDTLNAQLFKGQLKRPILAFSDTRQRLGHWIAEGRRMELSRYLLTDVGWGVLVEVLKHEMAHQYLEEVLGEPAQEPHGEAFRRICEQRGIDPAASGLPGAATLSADTERVLDRVTKLFRLAEQGETHEAEAAMAAARRLMLKYNLTQLHRSSYAFSHLGEPTGRVSEAERILASILDEHFFVQVIWVPVWQPLRGKSGSVLEICGNRENLELAGHVYAFLRDAAERSWQAYKKTSGLPGNALRREYLAGVMTGFRDKLAAAQKRHKEQGLVWVGDAQLTSYFKRRHPRVRWIRGTGKRRPEAFTHGRAAGRQLDLHPPVPARTSGETRLLPGRH